MRLTSKLLSCSLDDSRHRNRVHDNVSCCFYSEKVESKFFPPDRDLQVSDGPSLLLNSPVLVASPPAPPAPPASEASSSEEHQVQLLEKQLQQQEQQALAAAAQVFPPRARALSSPSRKQPFVAFVQQFFVLFFNSVTVRSNN